MSVGLSEVLTIILCSCKGSPLLVALWGNFDPGLVFSVEVDISILAVVVLEVISGDFLAVDGVDVAVGFFFFPVDRDDLLSMLCLFLRGVQMILFLETSGVILGFGGVLWLLAGDSDGGGLPGTPVASS